MTHRIPESQRALQELSPLVNALSRILPQIAQKRVIHYFETEALPIDDTLATHMIRYEIRRALLEQGIYAYYDEYTDVDGETSESLALKQLNLNGIEGLYGGWLFKILRSRNGDVPPPGRSSRRRQFYCQVSNPPLPGFEDATLPQRTRPNVVIMWDHDAEYRRFEIRIAVPRRANGAYGRVECHFNIAVPSSFDPVIKSIIDDALSDRPQEPELTPKDIEFEIEIDDFYQEEPKEEGHQQSDSPE